MPFEKNKYNIKELEPVNGNIRQGYFRPKNKTKYVGDVNKIIYRSSWELKFLMFCDENENIIRYSSESVPIPYFNPIVKRTYNYYIDFFVVSKAEDGSLNKWIIEVKPYKKLFRPQVPKKKTEKSIKNYDRDMKEYIVNQMKFEAARNYAKHNGLKFGIITEKFLFNTL